MLRENTFNNEKNDYSLSVIIPAYNAEKYIAECLDSILNQVSDNTVEIICVNDGSSDGTIELLNEYAAHNNNIRCFDHKHEGAGVARNYGLSKANGKYVAFLDADDYYEDGAISRIRDACLRSESKIIGFAYWKLLDNHEIRQSKILDFSDTDCIPEDGKLIKLSDWQNDYGYTNFIFERELLRRNNIVFPPYMRYEDPVFLLKALCIEECFMLVPASIYICRVGYKDSSELDRTIADILRGIKDNLRMAQEHNLHALRATLLHRVDGEFYEPIYRNLSDEVMSILLEISEINRLFVGTMEIAILHDVYKGTAGQRIAERNYDREQVVIRDYRIFNNVTECMKRPGGFGGYLSENGIKKVCVYGAGLYGRMLVQDFILHGLEIVSVIDRDDEGDVEGIKIVNLDSALPECELLIIALRNPEQVVNAYRQKGLRWVIGLSELTDRMILNQSIKGDQT